VTTPLAGVDRIRLFDVDLRFRQPLATPDGVYTGRRSVIVALDGNGHTGWGEAPTFPSGRWGTIDQVWEALAAFDPAGDSLPDTPVAAAGLQAALADLAARRAGLPLYDYLGGSRTAVTARGTVGFADEPGDTVARIGALTAAGVRAVKLKIGPGRDLVPVQEVRRAFPHLDISVDANGQYSSAADPVFAGLDDLGVTLIEQPLPSGDLAGLRDLRGRIRAAVCVDESIRSVGDAGAILDAGAADVLSVKVNRLGLAAWRQILRLAIPAGVGVKIGGTFDTAIGRRHLLAAATLDGVVDAEIAPPTGYLRDDFASYPPLIAGAVTPEAVPGIGTEPSLAEIERLMVRSTSIRR